MKKKNYNQPTLKVVEFKAELGFALSTPPFYEKINGELVNDGSFILEGLSEEEIVYDDNNIFGWQ